MELRLPVSAGELTRAEQKILDYINTNMDSFLYLPIGQLAQQLGLSDATLSRFARHVGCRDFKALKSLVVEQMSGPAGKMAGTLAQEADFSPEAWLQRQQLYLEKTAQQLRTPEFHRAADALVSARRVLIHGKNASAALAQMLSFRLRRLGLEVSLLPSGGSELLEGLVQAGEGDLVVMFSFHLFGGAGVHALNVDAFCILQSQGQLVAPQFQFDGVAHGGNLAQGHQRARGEAHVQKMAAQRAGAIHRRDGGGFADRQLIKCHCVNPSFEKTGQPPRLWYGFNTLL